ncbi:hypothetical protein ACVME8_007715 [Bradyrhizobium diazoefficiens]
MTRTKRQADPLLCAVAAAQGRVDQPDALFAALDEAVKSAIGHKLFTILTYDGDSGEAARIYSNLPGPYPTGGRKRLAPARGPRPCSIAARPISAAPRPICAWCSPTTS